MEPTEHPASVHVGAGPDGSLTYLVRHAAGGAAVGAPPRPGARLVRRARRRPGAALGRHPLLPLPSAMTAHTATSLWPTATHAAGPMRWMAPIGLRNSYGLVGLPASAGAGGSAGAGALGGLALPAAARRRRAASLSAARRGERSVDRRRRASTKPGSAAGSRNLPSDLRWRARRCAAPDRSHVVSRLRPAAAAARRSPDAAAATAADGQARADAATLAACREHADAVYDRNNRDTIYTISNRDSPFSANYMPA